MPAVDLLAGRTAAVVILLPALGVLAAVAQVVRHGVTAFELGLLGVMYVLTLVGVEVGFHRLIAHRGLSAPAAVRLVLAALGSMTAQGPIVWWVTMHRRHHEDSDAAQDPHSPHRIGGRATGGWRGFVHAHIGWMWSVHRQQSDSGRYVRDILRDPVLVFAQRSYFAWVAAGLLLPGLLGWWWLGGVQGAGRGVLWGGLVRLFLVHQAMWCVASVCHLFGSRPYRTPGDDRSRNNAWVAIVTLGEGWHNNHHAFPSSARHGLEWWQVDVNYCLIRLLSVLGLARDVRVPNSAARATRRATEKAA